MFQWFISTAWSSGSEHHFYGSDRGRGFSHGLTLDSVSLSRLWETPDLDLYYRIVLNLSRIGPPLMWLYKTLALLSVPLTYNSLVRPTIGGAEGHGWKLWAKIISPVSYRTWGFHDPRLYLAPYLSLSGMREAK